jgi:hypothetical protein
MRLLGQGHRGYHHEENQGKRTALHNDL